MSIWAPCAVGRPGQLAEQISSTKEELVTNIDLRINGIGCGLRDRLDTQKLASAQCSKVGFLSRLLMKAPSGYLVYWAKNCQIACFVDEFAVWANLDWKAGTEMISGTSAYLYFKNLMLEKVAFQVLENETMAVGATLKCQTLCRTAFGTPASGSPSLWLDADSVILCSLSYTRTRALFQWMTRQYADAYGSV